jgi:hypothetical protein
VRRSGSARHLVYRLLGESLGRRQGFPHLLELVALGHRLTDLRREPVDIKSDSLGGVRPGGPKGAPEVGILPLDAGDRLHKHWLQATVCAMTPVR